MSKLADDGPLNKLAVAGLSARSMAQAAARDGFGVVALDLFGDVDTCAVATRWFGIGDPSRQAIDGERLLAALALLARQGEVAGWVAGSGFEARPDLLAQGAALLPLVGNPPEVVARLRDPARFFGFLTEHDIDHPPVRLTPGGDGSGWLLKDLHGCGGRHIRRAAAADLETLAPGQYLQREVVAEPMSVTFVANGSDMRLLGCNRQIVRAQGALPYVWCGVVGPVNLAAAVQRRLQAIVRTVVAGLSLRGLASLDFLLDRGRVLVLEVNPRPSASVDLYPLWQPMGAHVRACLQGKLPVPVADGSPVRGLEVVYARQPLRLDAALAEGLAALADVHDVPAAGQWFAVGEPLCSVSASGRSAAAVHERLRERRDALLHSLEMDS